MKKEKTIQDLIEEVKELRRELKKLTKEVSRVRSLASIKSRPGKFR